MGVYPCAAAPGGPSPMPAENTKDKYAKDGREVHLQIGCDQDPACHGCQIIAAFGLQCAAEAWEEAAKEAFEPQFVLLTKADIADGMLDDKHPVISARRVMRENIAKRLMARAATLRKEGR